MGGGFSDGGLYLNLRWGAVCKIGWHVRWGCYLRWGAVEDGVRYVRWE